MHSPVITFGIIALVGHLALGVIHAQSVHQGITQIQDGRMTIHKIDLSSGAELRHLVGTPQASPGTRSYYGPNSRDTAYPKRSQTSFINDLADEPCKAALINGQFFDLSKNPTCLAFPVYSDRLRWVSGGCESPNTWPYEADRLLLEIHDRGATLGRLYNDGLVGSSAKFRLAGLVAGKNLKGSWYQNQTMIALGDYHSRDSRYRTLYILSGRYVRERDAINTLVRYGAARDKIMLMDGGGSTFLSTWTPSGQRTDNIRTSRQIPHAIAVLAAPEPTPILTDTQKAKHVFRTLEQRSSAFPANQRGTYTETSGIFQQRYHNGTALYIDRQRMLWYFFNRRWTNTNRNLDWWYAWSN